MADERKRFYKGSGIAKHREWRGLKDTFYDYLQWAENLGILVQFAARSPVRIVKGLFEYRWFGGYIGALHMVDKCTAGLRGPALRTAHIHMHAIMKGTTGMLRKKSGFCSLTRPMMSKYSCALCIIWQVSDESMADRKL